MATRSWLFRLAVVAVFSLLVSACGCSTDSGPPRQQGATGTEAARPSVATAEPDGQMSRETRIGATFSRFPAPDQADPWLTVTLPPDQWPEGSTVTLDPSQVVGWQFAAEPAAEGDESPAPLADGTRQLPIRAGQSTVFKVTAPAALRLAADGFDPPLVIQVDVREDAVPAARPRLPNRWKCFVVPDARQSAEITALPEPVSVPRAAAAIVIDGRLDEWQTVPFINRPVHVTASQAVRLAWSDRGLYGAVDADDSSIRIDPDNTHLADALELWIETDAARALDITRNPNAHKFVFLPAVGVPEAGPSKAHARVVLGCNADASAKLDAAWARTDRGYTIEFLIPAECLHPAVLAAGKRMGFHYILFNDAAHGEDLIPYIPGFWRRPYQWGALALE